MAHVMASQLWRAYSDTRLINLVMVTMGRIEVCEVTPRPLDLGVHQDAVQDPRAGAIATFAGAVRDHDPANPNPVVFLEYQAYPSASSVLRSLAEEFADRDGLCAIAVSHRVDARLMIGELAIVCAVSSAHRRTALDVCSELVERIKHELPVWKLQQFADGSQEWVNCP